MNVSRIEAFCQLRPKALLRVLAHPNAKFQAGMRWYSNIGRRVWPFEIWQWLFHDRRTRTGPTLAEFLRGAWEGKQTGQENRGKSSSPAQVSPGRPVAAAAACR